MHRVVNIDFTARFDRLSLFLYQESVKYQRPAPLNRRLSRGQRWFHIVNSSESQRWQYTVTISESQRWYSTYFSSSLLALQVLEGL